MKQVTVTKGKQMEKQKFNPEHNEPSIPCSLLHYP
jgi:hypothetical protein